MTPLSTLTPAQQDVLRMMAQGYGNAAIARRRRCRVSTVENLIAEIYRRLGLGPRGDLNPRVEAARIFVAADGLPGRE